MGLRSLGLGGVFSFNEKPGVQGMGRARDEFGRFVKTSDRAQTTTEKVSKSFSNFGKVLKTAGIVGGLAAITAGLKKSIVLASEFEMGMAKISTLMSEGGTSMEEMSKDVLKMSDDYGIATKQMTEGMFQAISAGVDETKSIEFMNIASKAAVGGFTDIEVAVDGLTTFMNVYGITSMEEMKKVSDSVFVANKLGKTTFDEISRSVGRAAATAKGAGVTYNELLSTIVAVTKGGISTTETMSGLKAALAGIGKPTADAVAEADRLGIAFSTAAVQQKGWAQFMKEVAVATDGDKKSIEKLFGSVEAGNLIMAMTSKTGFADFQESLGAMAEGAGTTEEAFKKVAGTTTHQWKTMTNTLDNLSTESGSNILDTFSGVFNQLAESFSDYRQATGELEQVDFSNVHEAQKKMLELNKKYGNDTVMLAQIVSGVTTVITTAFKALGYAIGAVFWYIDQTVGEFVRGFMEYFTPIVHFVKQIITNVSQLFDTLFGWLFESTGETAGNMTNIFRTFGRVVGSILTVLLESLAKLLEWLSEAIMRSRSLLEEGLAAVHEAGAKTAGALGIISEESERKQVRIAQRNRAWIKRDEKARISEVEAAKKRIADLSKMDDAGVDIKGAPAAADRKRDLDRMTMKTKKPSFNVNLKNTLCIDGKAVGHSIKKQQQEISERSGFKTQPWQRSMIEHGAIPVALSARSE